LDVAFNADNAAWGLNGTIAANRRYPQWQGIDAIYQNGYSNYNALQAKFEKRGKFWSTLTSFTWASSINTTETSTSLGGNTSQIILQTPAGPVPDEDGERGFAASLSRVRLTSATTWDIPIGRKQRFGSNIGRALDMFIGGLADFLYSDDAVGAACQCHVGRHRCRSNRGESLCVPF